MKMKSKFQYTISGKLNNFKGEVVGEGKDYDETLQNAYNTICTEEHNQFLTITFKKVD